MTRPDAEHPPLYLGMASAADPFAIQPGVILFERFCVIGRVRHAQGTWWVTATDLERRLGVEPHHRVELHFVAHEPSQEYAIRSALSAHQRGAHRIEGLLTVDGGMVLVAAPSPETPIRLPLAADEASMFVRTLVAIAAGMRRAGLVGIRFDLRDLRLGSLGEVQFAGWRHLASLRFEASSRDRAVDEDARALVELVRSLGGTASTLVPSGAPSIDALQDALASDRQAADKPGPEVLPSRPPFVGRSALVASLQEAAARARNGQVQVKLVGAQGIGRSRVLDQLALELHRWNSLLVVSCSFRRSSPRFGLEVLLDEISVALEGLPLRERVDTVARIRRALGPMITLLRPSRISHIVGLAEELPTLHLVERFIRLSHVVVELIGALGTPERPLALLLDDADQADASVQAVQKGLSFPGRHAHMFVVLASTHDTGRPADPHDVPEIAVEPLTVADARQLLSGSLSGPIDGLEVAATRLHAESGGNPSAMWSAVQTWVATSRLYPTDDGRWRFDSMDATEMGALSAFGRLDEVARFVALLASLRITPVTVHWLVEVAGLPPQVTRAAASALIGSKLLLQDATGRVMFTDERSRQQVLALAEPADVTRAHTCIAVWLRSRVGIGGVSQEAWHLEHATAPGLHERLAEMHASAGAYHLEQCDAMRAQWHFARVLERSDARELLLIARHGVADALLLQDDISGAHQAYMAVLDEVEDPLVALATVNRASHALYLRGATEELLALSRRALKRVGQHLPSGPVAALVSIAVAFARAMTGTGPADPAIAEGLVWCHATLSAGVSTKYPHIGLASLFAAYAAASRHHTPASARGRALFSVFLATIGMHGAMRRMLDRAEHDAKSDPLQLGAVLHFRAQNELSLGRYDEGQAAAGRAVAAFRTAGDMSVGVITQAFGLFYAIDREPVSELQARIAESRASAWRQRNTALRPAIDGIALLVEVRAGLLGPEEIAARVAMMRFDGDLVGYVIGEALVALALVSVGQGTEAVAWGVRAHKRLEAMAPPPFLEIARAAEAAALVAGGDLTLAIAATRKAVRRGRSVPSVQVLTRMTAARLAIRRDRTAEAIALLCEVIEQTPQHRELWHTRDAHLLMGQLLAGRDVVAAAGHTAMADALGARLGIQTPPQARPAAGRDPQVARTHGATNTDSRLWEVIDRLSPTFRAALPGDMTLGLHPVAGIRAEADPAIVELLIVNLFLLARDASRAGAPRIAVLTDEVDLTPEGAAEIPGARPGRWARLEINTAGQLSKGTQAALLECRTLATQCGGFLSVDATDDGQLVFRGYFQAPVGPPPAIRGLAAVGHRDPRVARMLVEGIQRASWSAVELNVGARCPAEAAIAFVDVTLDPALFALPPGCVRVGVGRRGAPAQLDGATVMLNVPFLVGELEGALAAASGHATPSGAGSRQV